MAPEVVAFLSLIGAALLAVFGWILVELVSIKSMLSGFVPRVMALEKSSDDHEDRIRDLEAG